MRLSVSFDDGPVTGLATGVTANARWRYLSLALTALVVITMGHLAFLTMPPIAERAGQACGGCAGAPSRAVKPRDGTSKITVGLVPGDNLPGVFVDAGATRKEAFAAAAAIAAVFDIRTLRVGQLMELSFDAVASSADQPVGRLSAIVFSPSPDRRITASRAASGFVASDKAVPLTLHQHHVRAAIDGSLYTVAVKSGIPEDAVVELIRLFSYKVDLQRDMKPGDSFEVFYDYYYGTDGSPARKGTIAYAALLLGGRTTPFYGFDRGRGQMEYFSAKGESARSRFMRTPVDGARITSRFGLRDHPILGFTRMHKGVDFSVPVGTPVMASSDGVVAFAGWRGGYGRYILIKHAAGLSTGYGHLSRFSAGLRAGARVQQGRIIGYSGASGLATGPHLHYEVLVRNVQVNPLRLNITGSTKLQGRELRDFMAEKQRIDRLIAATPVDQPLVLTAGASPKRV